jgi:hypothetical protein
MNYFIFITGIIKKIIKNKGDDFIEKRKIVFKFISWEVELLAEEKSTLLSQSIQVIYQQCMI